MEKLELKHLAPYLPYELKFYDNYSEKIFGKIEKIDLQSSFINENQKKKSA